MNQIDTSQIVDPLIEEPWTGPMLAFMQAGSMEALSNSIIAQIGALYSTSSVYILWGCVVTAGSPLGAGNVTISAGAIFINGEVYTFPGPVTATMAGGQTIYFYALNTNGAPDPVTFSDGVARNVCNIRQAALHVAATGSPNPYLSWVHLTGTWVTPSFTNSWVDGTGGAVGYPPRFRLENFGQNLHLSGITSGGSTGNSIFTLPAGYIPAFDVHKAVVVGGQYMCGLTINGLTSANPGRVTPVFASGTVVDIDCIIPMT